MVANLLRGFSEFFSYFTENHAFPSLFVPSTECLKNVELKSFNLEC